MSLSTEQHHLLTLMLKGHKLLVQTSPLDGRVVGAKLWDPDQGTSETIALWRVEKLIERGRLRPSMREAHLHREWTVTSLGAGRRAKREVLKSEGVGDGSVPKTAAQNSARRTRSGRRGPGINANTLKPGE